MSAKRKYKRGAQTTGGASVPPTESRVTTKAELVATLQANRAASPKPKCRVDTRVGRKRRYSDGVDDFELELWRHGVNFEDLWSAAQQYAQGTQSPYHKLANAVIRWWCSLPMGARQVLWVDQSSGYTERNCPKFSTVAGAQLQQRGLAGARWVHSRLELLRAREWRQQMLTLTPQQRLRVMPEIGEDYPAAP
jgi:hypothetical protein